MPQYQLEGTILAVDDNPMNLDMLFKHLTRAGLRVIVAESGEQGLQKAREHLPDLILLDVMMPGLNGFETCAALKETEATRAIPVIFMTALSDIDSKIQAFDAGGVDYVTKPVEIRETMARIKTHLTLAHLRQQLRRDSTHDSLTNLPNRVLFRQRLAEAMARQETDPAANFAVLFIDLDQFKIINDSLGHAAGDQLLLVVSQRLVERVRPQDVVARLGGDEFAILLAAINGAEEVSALVDRIQTAFAEPVSLEASQGHTHRVQITASIGVALSNEEYNTPEEILRDADLTMYQAKNRGRARAVLFEPPMRAEAMTHLHLHEKLHPALRQQEFEVLYQPLIKLADETVVGVEASISWQHPQLGQLRPAEFIPLILDTGLIIPLSQWFLNVVCEQFQQWRAAGQPELGLIIDLAAWEQLEPKVLGELVLTTLGNSSLPAQACSLILSPESMADPEVLDGLKKAGICMALEDLDALCLLSTATVFPLGALKLQEAFVARLPGLQRATILVETLIDLAHRFEMCVMAEGIANAKQARLLHQLGCDVGQGPYFAPPMASEACTAHLRQDG